jgi:prophage antirepressor-like protein
LDILTGHPEHAILFIATQVARASGLKDPKGAIGKFRHNVESEAYQLKTLVAQYATNDIPKEASGKALRTNTLLINEANVYRLLLRGRAPQSEPFRKWVTEIVLPSIRKTGKFDANEAQDKASIQFSGEFAQLPAEITEGRPHGEVGHRGST